MIKKIFRCINRSALYAIPLVLVVLSVAGFLTEMEFPRNQKEFVFEKKEELKKHFTFEDLDHKEKHTSVKSKQYTEPFIIAMKGEGERGNLDQTWIQFKSRHIMELKCREKMNDTWIDHEKITEMNVHEPFVLSEGGFGLKKWKTSDLQCEAKFRGPGKLQLLQWESSDFDKNERFFLKQTGRLEGGIGILCIFLSLVGFINRERIYLMFGVWLFLNLRMAMLAAGTDWWWFSFPVDEDWIIPLRQWTIATYVAATLLFFNEIFKKDLKNFKIFKWWTWTKRFLVSSVLICAAIFSYEKFVQINWIISSVGIVCCISNMVLLIYTTRSKVAIWYISSMLVNMLSNLAEVIQAALGAKSLVFGFNSISGAIAASLLASLALAQQMKEERRQKDRAEKKLSRAYEINPIGLFSVNEKGIIQRDNKAFRDLLSWNNQESIYQMLSSSMKEQIREVYWRFHNQRTIMDHDDEQLSFQVQYDKNSRWFEISFLIQKDSPEIEGSIQDITEKVLSIGKLEYLADHDPLTQCLNLRGARKVLHEKEARYGIEETQIGYLDLDRFKLVNDLYGHKVGDEVLKQVCLRVQQVIHEGDVLARVGGDEFVLIFHCSMKEAVKRAKEILNSITLRNYEVGSKAFMLGASLGLVESAAIELKNKMNASTQEIIQPQDDEMEGGRFAGEVIACADAACRMAKKREDHFVIYERGSVFFKQRSEELSLLNELERGKVPDGFFLVMQPIMSIVNPFESLNFEILLRMKKNDGSIMSAASLIQTAEAHGKVEVIDRWVLKNALEWIQENYVTLQPKTYFICINLSGGSLNDEMFIADALNLFKANPQAASLVCLEITESIALRDLNNIRKFIQEVSECGVRVAIDDFGSDYSSFGYLKGLPAHALKIDGSLISEVDHNPTSLAIVISISGLVQTLGMQSVAEFAENINILKIIGGAGVNYVQGWAISKPIMPEEILKLRSSADAILDPAVREYAFMLQNGTTQDLFPDPDVPIIH